MQTPTTSDPANAPIVARAGHYYRNTRYVIVLAMVLYGIWSIRDGFWKFPQDNARARAQGLVDLPHGGFDAPLNKILGIVLPPLGLVFLGWTLYSSRGEYRYDGALLSVPGHPPMPLSAIQTIDRSKWDRKGIATVSYELKDTKQTGTFKLDDFVYDRAPTDKIFKVIENSFAPSPVPAADERASEEPSAT